MPVTFNTWSDNTSGGWDSSTSSVITYTLEQQFVPPVPSTPKPQTALDWLRAQVDEIREVGRRELVPA